jgi:hypothetical protein
MADAYTVFHIFQSGITNVIRDESSLLAAMPKHNGEASQQQVPVARTPLDWKYFSLRTK